MSTQIPGYTYGHSSLETSPVSVADLLLLKQTLLWSDADDKHLRQAGEILESQIDQILDLWYGFVGSHPHLVHYFTHHGQPNMEYLTRVRARFGQWIKDLCNRPYGQSWLDYQHEIALRHHSRKKNITDQVQAVPIVHARYLLAFIVPLTVTIRGFLEKGDTSAAEVEGMYQAWFKAVTLTAILWVHPYIHEGEF